MFTIANVVNPDAAVVVSDATVKSYNSGSLFYTDDVSLFTYSAVIISTCLLKSSSDTVGETATLSVTCTLNNDVPSGGVIEISFPKWIDSDYGASVPVTMLDSVSGCSASEDIVGN